MISKISVIENSISTFCDSSKLLKDGKVDFSITLSIAVSLVIIIFTTILINSMSSEKRKQKIIEKEKIKHKE